MCFREKRKNTHKPVLTLTMQSPHFPSQFSNVQITRSRKHPGTHVRTHKTSGGPLRKSGDVTADDHSDPERHIQKRDGFCIKIGIMSILIVNMFDYFYHGVRVLHFLWLLKLHKVKLK